MGELDTTGGNVTCVPSCVAGHSQPCQLQCGLAPLGSLCVPLPFPTEVCVEEKLGLGQGREPVFSLKLLDQTVQHT